MQIKIVIEPKHSKHWPKLIIKINDKVLFDADCIPNNQKHFVWQEKLKNLKHSNILEIIHHGKKGTDTVVDSDNNIIEDSAIILKSIEFDTLPVPEVVLYENKFFPNWPDQPEYIKNNLYFGFNGSYKIDFTKDSKRMYFKNLLLKEKLANKYNKKIIQLPSGKEIESFEFNGIMVNSEKKDSITIEDLYKAVTK